MMQCANTPELLDYLLWYSIIGTSYYTFSY